MKHHYKLISQKFFFEMNNVKEKFFLKIGIYDENLVVFDGGLGSQIMSFFQMNHLINQGKMPQVNIEYYKKNKLHQSDENFVYREWALGRYGIPIDALGNFNVKITDSNLKVPTNLLPKKDPNYFKKFQDLDLKEQLQVNKDSIDAFLKKNGVDNHYYAIHLRRGDFLKAASKVVQDIEVMQFAKKLFPNLTKFPIFVFSDSPVDVSWKGNFLSMGFNKVILCGPEISDKYLVHDLLRNAKILVTSNSTFSLSAALLANDGSIAIMPNEFYAGFRDEPVNKLLSQLTNFSILN
jgi:hypothetical protein